MLQVLRNLIIGAFIFKGTMNRKYYFGTVIIAGCISSLWLFLSVGLVTGINQDTAVQAFDPGRHQKLSQFTPFMLHNAHAVDIVIGLLGLDTFFLMWVGAATSIKRLRDMGWSPWNYAWMFGLVMIPNLIHHLADSNQVKDGCTIVSDISALIESLILIFWPPNKVIDVDLGNDFMMIQQNK